jgi:hypothetical protein
MKRRLTPSRSPAYGLTVRCVHIANPPTAVRCKAALRASGCGDHEVSFPLHPWRPAHGLPMRGSGESNNWEVPACQLEPATLAPELPNPIRPEFRKYVKRTDWIA